MFDAPEIPRHVTIGTRDADAGVDGKPAVVPGQHVGGGLGVDESSGRYPQFKGNVATVYSHPMAQGGSGNGHYGGNSEVYMDVGLVMGQAMATMLTGAR